MRAREEDKKRVIAIYSYRGPDGAELYQVIRYHPKTFRVRHKNKHRAWVWKAPTENVPYRLPELLKAKAGATVFIVEGEKDVDLLTEAGLVATCNRGGAGRGRFKKDWGEFFAGKEVCVIPDNDDPGREHAEAVVEIVAPHAKDVVLLELPGVPDKGDVTDWFAIDGNSIVDFLLMVRNRFAESFRLRQAPPAAPPAEPSRGDAWEGDQAAADDRDDLDDGWKPFPLDTLPAVLADYVRAGSKALPCDPALIAVPALVCCAGLIGNTRVIQLKATWQEPSILWGCCIAEPGAKKSPAFDLAKDPVAAIDFQLSKENRKRQEFYEYDLAAWENRNGKRNGTPLAHAEDPRPARPDDQKHTISDITVETVIKELQRNPRGLVLLRDELRGWFQGFGRYSSTGSSGPDLAFWLEAHRGRLYRYDRKSGDGCSLTIPRASVSIYGTIQPQVMQRLFSKEFFESGFAYRLLMCLPPRHRSRWTEDVIPFAVKERYAELLKQLHQLDAAEVREEEFSPQVVMLEPDAYRAWIHHHDQIESKMDDSMGDAAQLLEKLKANLARFALVFAVIDGIGAGSGATLVHVDQVDRAARLMWWFFAEIQRVYAMIHAPEEKFESDRILEWIKGRGGFCTARDLYKSNKSRYASSARAQVILEDLERKGMGKIIDRPPGPHGGRPSRAFYPETP